MINEQALRDKFLYFFITELGNKFEIMDFRLEIDFSDYPSKEEVESYDVDIKFDYQPSIEADLIEFLHNISDMMNQLRNVLMKYGITKSGKLVYNHDFYVSDGSIFQVDFDYDDKQEFNVFFRVNNLK